MQCSSFGLNNIREYRVKLLKKEETMFKTMIAESARADSVPHWTRLRRNSLLSLSSNRSRNA